MKKLNVAFMGTGHIAHVVAETVRQMQEICLYAAASRTIDKAEAFKNEFGFEKAYGTYEAMLQDPNVDLVYIATPHGQHAQYLKLCIDYKKNILCEKAFTLTYPEAKEVFDYARGKGIFIAEAIWCRYAPMAKTISDFVKSGKLGKINTITANLGYNVWHRERVHKRELGGGALLDVGIYCLNFVDLIDNSPIKKTITTACVDEVEKTDKYETVTLCLESGATATVYNSLINQTDRYGAVYGSEGYLIVDNVNNYSRLRAFDNTKGAGPYLDIKAPEMISGYEYEFLEAKRCIENNLTESPYATWDQSLKLMKTMDRIRKDMLVIYPVEEK